MNIKLIISILTLSIIIFGFSSDKQLSIKGQKIQIDWSDSIPGDFSFTKKWSYLLGVEMKSDGRAGWADGSFAPERCYSMLDSNRIVLNDSAEIFYQLLDTTHQFHTIQCEAWCYEWLGTNFITVNKSNTDTFECFTHLNMATHRSLHLIIIKNICYPTIELRSITEREIITYQCNGGQIQIDRNLWNEGIMKGSVNQTLSGYNFL